MTSPNLMYKAAGGTVTGQIDGKTIQFNLRPAQGGMPKPGDYRIYAPINHPVHGSVALMIPLGSLGPAASMGRGPAQGFQYTPSRDYQYVSNRGFQYESNGAFQYDPNRSFQYDSNKAYQYAGNQGFQYGPTLAPQGGQAFLLGEKAIAGQNSLVIAFGAADMMNALQAAGGASIRVW